ncbi:glycosyltransferase [Nesterenkonia natronophila]|uniref:glycosyltransferase n=1 Tax=Nesterenkonia natronophila TaxID=2174932 RepID=UPI0013148902|nr:glycosyltransferase [Nesterenkonia natronophila]
MEVRIVIPARNEEDLLPLSLGAVRQAIDYAAHHEHQPVSARITVVADRCRDNSAAAAAQWADEVMTLDAGSVGAARSAGFATIFDSGNTRVPDEALLLCTDADSLVPRTWLTEHLRHTESGADAVAGMVSVRDWAGRRPSLQAQYERAYAASATHVHGANLSFTAATYRAVGGFSGRATGEDQGLVDRIAAAGLRVDFCSRAPVVTSARSVTRAEHGFGHYLNSLEAAS